MLKINDEDTCKICGAYFQDTDYCSNGHIRLKADLIREHFKKTDEIKFGRSTYTTWINDNWAVSIHENDDEIVAVYGFKEQEYLYMHENTKKGLLYMM